MNNDKVIQFLKYRIEETQKKINNQRRHGINEQKIRKLEYKKMEYEDKLAEIE
jgi:hypothetical protein